MNKVLHTPNIVYDIAKGAGVALAAVASLIVIMAALLVGLRVFMGCIIMYLAR